MALLTGACGGGASTDSLSGSVKADGSSTVFPITEAVAEEFSRLHRGVRITVGVSGTGGGFQRFTRGETDINDASRPIKPSEREIAARKGVEFLELPVALDGTSVVVHRKNTWVDHLTVEELKQIWEPGSRIDRWNQVRPNWPDKSLRLYGPGTNSGTFDHFTEVIVGEGGASRADYTASEDDNILAIGVAGDRASLGYFGYVFYVANQDILKLVPIDGGDGPVAPTEETVASGAYEPLSRPLFIYVNRESLERPEVYEFVQFYLTTGPLLLQQIGYVPLLKEEYEKGLALVREAVSASP